MAQKTSSRIPIGAGLGVAFGAAAGIFFHSIPMFAGIGIAIGAGLGGMLDILRRRRGLNNA